MITLSKQTLLELNDLLLTMTSAIIRAGIPQHSFAIFHEIQLSLGDPVALIDLILNQKRTKRILIVRDIEVERTRAAVTADHVVCPDEYTPEGGLSPDREIATAQAAAEYLRQQGVAQVTADRTLPLIFQHVLTEAGILVLCDPNLGVMERRKKNEEEIEHLRRAQEVTEEAIRLACQMIANADTRANGSLEVNGTPLTSERVRAAVNIFLMEKNFGGPTYIIAGGSQGADCHHYGSGCLYTGQPVIIDIFPKDLKSHYCGDCTRTVVHGDIPHEIQKMVEAVQKAKAAGCEVIRPGIEGHEVHAATTDVLIAHGYNSGSVPENADPSYTTMPHGTGHGIGLEVHEPPLLDPKGIALVKGDALTVEPGLYRKDLGGVRVEDMVVVTEAGHMNLNVLPEGLDWKT